MAAGKWDFYECRSLFSAPFSGYVVRKLVCLALWVLLTCGWLHVASREIMLISTPDICGSSLCLQSQGSMLCSPCFQPQLLSAPPPPQQFCVPFLWSSQNPGTSHPERCYFSHHKTSLQFLRYRGGDMLDETQRRT